MELPERLDVVALVPAHLSEDDPWRKCYISFLIHVYDQGRSPGTLRSYSFILHHFFSISAHGGPPKRPHLYTREDVEYFISVPFQRVLTLAPGTRNNRLSVISSFYKFASTYLIERDGALTPLFRGVPPTTGIKQQRVRPHHRALSYEEMERFFAVIPSDTVKGLRDRAVFLTYFWTARRREEIARLRWGDLRWGTMLDEDQHSYEGWIYRFTGKGDGGQDDFAELPQPAKDAIDAYLSASGRASTMTPDSPLFLSTTKRTGRPLAGGTIYNLFKIYCRRASLDTSRLTLHSFRHTAMWQRYSHGEKLRALQRLLRHKNIATTNDYLMDMESTADPGARLLMKDDRFTRFSYHPD